jgi:hypothetical protein
VIWSVGSAAPELGIAIWPGWKARGVAAVWAAPGVAPVVAARDDAVAEDVAADAVVVDRDVVLVVLAVLVMAAALVAAAEVLAAEVVALDVAPDCAVALGVLPAPEPQAVASIPIAALAPRPSTVRRVKR